MKLFLKKVLNRVSLPSILLIEFEEAHSPKDEQAGARIKEHIDLLLRSGMRCIAVDGSNMTLERVSED